MCVLLLKHKNVPFMWTTYGVSATCTGPGAYNIAGMGSESMRKAYIESTRRGVFGTTAVRINPMTKKGEHDQPGPSHYQVRERGHEPRYQQLTSNFSSLTQRLPDTVPAVLKVGSVGSRSECTARVS